MSSLKLLVFAVVLSLVADESSAFFPLPKATSNNKQVLRKSIGFLELVKKRSEGSDGELVCYTCRNYDPSSKSCEGSFEVCEAGEVCASIFHSDNTNVDECMSATICDHLSQSEGINAHCCSTYLCNLGIK